MKIGVIGKGGSGKTSVSWMLSNALLYNNLNVFCLDADFNQHLGSLLQITISPPALADHYQELVAHAIGKRVDISLSNFDKSTRPQTGSGYFDLTDPKNPIQKFIKKNDLGIGLFCVGEFDSEARGMSCYHLRTAAADVVINHLYHTEDTVLVTDFTAGVDPLSSPLFANMDALVLVIEPTLKGVKVAQQWENFVKDIGIPLLALGNKINTPADSDWLKAQLGSVELLTLKTDPLIVAIEQGQTADFKNLLPENHKALNQLLGLLQSQHFTITQRNAFLDKVVKERLQKKQNSNHH